MKSRLKACSYSTLIFVQIKMYTKAYVQHEGSTFPQHPQDGVSIRKRIKLVNFVDSCELQR